MTSSKNNNNNLGDRMIKEALECPVCKDLFSEPKQLECGHTYCLICVEQLEKVPVIAHQIMGEDFFGVGPVSTLVQCIQNNVQCPQCRKMCLIPDGGLNTNYALKDMVEKFRESSLNGGGYSAGKDSKPNNKEMGTAATGDGGKLLLCCNGCAKRVPEEEMFVCKDCKSGNNRQPAKKQFLWCALCVINSHRQHNVIACTDLATTKHREQAALQIEAFSTQAHEFVERAKFIQDDLMKEFETIHKKLAIKCNHIQLLQIECFNAEMNPLKDDVEHKVREAGRHWEQFSKIYSQLHKLKLEFEGHLKHLDHNLDISMASTDPATCYAAAADQPTSSGMVPFGGMSPPYLQNQFAYNSGLVDKKQLRRPPRRRTRRISNTGGGANVYMGDSSSSVMDAALNAFASPGKDIFGKDD